MLCYFTCKFFQLIYNIKFSFADLLDISFSLLFFFFLDPTTYKKQKKFE